MMHRAAGAADLTRIGTLEVLNQYFRSPSPLRQRLSMKLASIDGAGTRPGRDGLAREAACTEHLERSLIIDTYLSHVTSR